MKKKHIGVYLTPMNYRFNKDVDTLVNSLLDHYELVEVSKHYAYFKISEKQRVGIWIENRWYGYASIVKTFDKVPELGWGFGEEISDNKRPSRKTMIRLAEKIDRFPKENPLSNLLESLETK